MGSTAIHRRPEPEPAPAAERPTRARRRPSDEERYGPSEFLTPREVGFHVRRSAAWAYQKISAGEIPAVRVCGSLRIKREDFERWLSAVTEECEP